MKRILTKKEERKLFNDTVGIMVTSWKQSGCKFYPGDTVIVKKQVKRESKYNKLFCCDIGTIVAVTNGNLIGGIRCHSCNGKGNDHIGYTKYAVKFYDSALGSVIVKFHSYNLRKI